MKLIKHSGDPEIPTSSMADIAFLLIVYFMVTATFSGLIAGAKALGCRTHETLTGGGGEVTTYLADDPSGWPEELRKRIRKPGDFAQAKAAAAEADALATPAGA